jgi:hypothetical protein
MSPSFFKVYCARTPPRAYITARSRLLGLGRAIEVLRPETLRTSLIDLAEQILKFYKDRI